MSMLLRPIVVFVVIFTALTGIMANAAGLTKQQIDAFRKLPLAQQQALAKQYGVDLNNLPTNSANTATNSNNFDQHNVLPRQSNESDTDAFDFDAKFAPKLKQLERFGLDLFSGQPTTFEPLNNVPVPADYLVGPGDSVKVMFFGKVNDAFDVTVNREGLLVIPDLPPISVVGLHFSEVKEAIVAQVAAKMIGVKASVSMGALRTMRIFVLGESFRPGAYSISSLSTITHALIASGGISDIGSLRNIQLKRSGKVVAHLDLYDLLIRGDNRNDITLQANDVVFIPVSGDLVSVSGQVRREAIFEMKANETYQDLIKMAGGFVSTAYASNTLVERFNGGSLRTLVNLDLSDSKKLALVPVNGDKVHIPAVSEQYKDAISLIGAVVRPGKLQWRENMHISSLLKSVHGDLLNIADLSYALVVREIDSQGHIEVMQFSPILAIENKHSDHDILLSPRDQVVIFSRYETIEAENRVLDKFAFTENEINQREQSVLWDQYQEKKFLEYIGAKASSDKTDDELNRKEFENANKSLMDLTANQGMARGKESEYALFSRRRLLAPIVLALKEQADLNDPVKLIEVDGNVKYPGVYPLPVNGKVSDLIVAAGGVLESAFLERAEVTRQVTKTADSTIKHLYINLASAMSHPDSEDNKTLESKDRLNILSIPNWQENVSVTLAGEVKFPGKYTIRRGEVLSSVLERAGGFTEFSAPKAAVFSRASLRQKEREHLQKLSEDLKRTIAARSFQANSVSTNVVSYAETKQLLNDLSKVQAVGRLVIDLEKITTKQSDVQLENGDVLYVPPLIQSVNVIGEVNVATAHMYDPSLSVKEYIQKSGGFKQRADEERIYIIKADGSVVIPEQNNWFAVKYNVPLETGDTIVVPLDADHMDNLTLYSTATQILYQLGVAVAAIGSL